MHEKSISKSEINNMELESMRQNFFIKMLHSYQGDAGCQLHKPEMMDAHVGQPFLF